MLNRSFSRVAFTVAASAVALVSPASMGCGGPTQVSFVNNERPNSASGAQGLQSNTAAHRENPGGANPELPNDDVVVEPERPAAETKAERALVHIHGPDGLVCSGVVIGPKLVATAQRCLKNEPKGLTKLAAAREYRVEIASSTLTWTHRRAEYTVVPDCRHRELDVGLLVLLDPVPWVVPLTITSAPGTGAKVQALGFGHCAGQKETMRERLGVVRNRDSEGMVIDVPLCKGDTGGAVLDGLDGDLIGLISRRDDPEGSPLRTTTISRLDTTQARELVAQARELAEGADRTKLKGVSCH